MATRLNVGMFYPKMWRSLLVILLRPISNVCLRVPPGILVIVLLHPVPPVTEHDWVGAQGIRRGRLTVV